MLHVDDLRFSYPALEGMAASSLFNGLSFSVARGEQSALLGAADAGKSTLARIVSGLVPRFTGGEIRGSVNVAGMDMRSTRPYDAVDTVGIIFQDPDEQIITTRCDVEVAFGLESLGVPRTEMEERIRSSLRLVGLEELRGRNPVTLSGGEKKRLLIACLAAVNPDLWVLDEIFQELDYSWRAALLRHLRAAGRTALFLDSRWSPLYGLWCRGIAALAAGVLAPARRGDETAADGPLAQEGVVLSSSLLPPGFRPTDGGGTPCMKVQGLRVSFAGAGSFSLDVEELTINRGTITALVGPNSSGKSTMGRILCGLLHPETGSISLRNDGPFARALPHALQGRVGYLFQNPDYQIFLPTVFEELSFGLRNSGTGSAERTRRVEEAIERFRLPAGRTPPAVMSYGARRRLQAATYFLLPRDLLILDEIDSGLGYREILALLAALHSESRGIVLVTHDIDLARTVASRVLVMDRGRIAEDLAPSGFGSLDSLAGVRD